LIRVTLDTNILVSAFFFEGSEPAVLRSALARRIRLISSIELMDELISVLDRKFHVDWEALTAYVFGLSRTAEIVKPRRLTDYTVRDRNDVKVVECGVSGRCSYIVTGDGDLLSLVAYGGIRILNATGLLKALQTQA
jgi:uncharacterized protein